MLAPALQNYAKDATTHSLARLSSDRPRYVKAFWLVVFLTCLSLSVAWIGDTYRTFLLGDLKTTIRANKLTFEFPDVYICNEKPISGSYYGTLSAEDLALISRFERLVNESFAGVESNSTNFFSYNHFIRLVNTLPFQFLSDKLGRRANQLVVQYFFNGASEPRIRTLRHKELLNCFALNFTDSDYRVLQNPSAFLQIGLFLDLPQPPATYDNWLTSPFNWNFNYGMGFSIPTGFSIFITPRGQHPSVLDPILLIGPGRSHRLSLKMQDTVYDSQLEAQKCVRGDEVEEFVDPYTLDKKTFKYSAEQCRHREAIRLSMERFNCIPGQMILPWDLRLTPSCFNLTQFPKSLILTESILKERESIIANAAKMCAEKVPCRRRTYSFSYSTSLWPTENDWYGHLRGHIADQFLDRGGPTPGLHYLVNNATIQQVHESLVLLEMTAEEFLNPEVVLSPAYGFTSLIADVGGLLGLFLGMSLLSALELLELLHDCCLIVWHRLSESRQRKTADDNSSAVVVSVIVDKDLVTNSTDLA